MTTEPPDPQPTAVRVHLRRVRVVRYASDGGYAPREWANAIADEVLDPGTLDGTPVRLGVQITKARAVDVWLRIEPIGSLGRKIAAALKRTRSDRMFGSRKALRRAIPGAKRSLAVLSAEIDGKPVRVLLAQPGD
ncbi:MAG: hypothetical protein AAGA55_07660 [Planctomycetota bacterium]